MNQENKQKLFQFNPEVSLGNLLTVICAIGPIAWVVVSDHYEIASLKKETANMQVSQEKMSQNQMNMMIALEGVKSKLDNFNWPPRRPQPN